MTYQEDLIQHYGFVDVAKVQLMGDHSHFIYEEELCRAWLRVPKDILARMEIDISSFSEFSHHSTDDVFLDELDAFKFRQAWQEATSTPIEQLVRSVYHREHCFVRQLPFIGQSAR